MSEEPPKQNGLLEVEQPQEQDEQSDQDGQLDPSIDPKKLVNQETGINKDLAEIGAYAEENAKEDQKRYLETFIDTSPSDRKRESNRTGEDAMAGEVADRARELVSDAEAKLMRKVGAEAETAFRRELERIRKKIEEENRQKIYGEANAKAEEIIRRLQGSNEHGTK